VKYNTEGGGGKRKRNIFRPCEGKKSQSMSPEKSTGLGERKEGGARSAAQRLCSKGGGGKGEGNDKVYGSKERGRGGRP